MGMAPEEITKTAGTETLLSAPGSAGLNRAQIVQPLSYQITLTFFFLFFFFFGQTCSLCIVNMHGYFFFVSAQGIKRIILDKCCLTPSISSYLAYLVRGVT